MNELLVKANEEVKKVVEYLRENEEMFDMMDLKLHEASFYDYSKDFPLCYKSDEKNTTGYTNFYYFCEDNYDMFIEDLKESFNIDFGKIRKQVGRTSKFYLADFVETTHCKIDIKDTLNNLLCDCATLNYTDITDDFEIVPYGNCTEDDEEVLDELEEISGFYDWFIDKIEDMKTVYDIISDFKENQVKYYKEFLENEEERLQEEVDEEATEENKREETVTCIKEKYNISDEDMDILKDNI